MKQQLTLIFVLFTFMVFGQQDEVKQELNQVKQDIKSIKKLNEKQQDKIIELQEVKTIKDEFDSRIKNIDKNVEAAKDRENTFLSWLIAVSGFITILLSVLSFLGYSNIRNLKNEYEKKTKEELEKIKEENVAIIAKNISNLREEYNNTIETIINDSFWEFELMGKSNIMVVNPNNEGDIKNLDPVLRWFKEKGGLVSNIPLNFDNPDAIIKAVNKNKIGNRFNVLLLENSDGRWKFNFKKIDNNDDETTKNNKQVYNEKVKNNLENAKKIAANIPDNVMLVYFGPGSSGFFPSKEIDYSSLGKRKDEVLRIVNRISFVNAPSKLYSNLIDALKYMDIINLESLS